VTGFAMLERDTVTGLNLAVYREENPGTGRWDSQDPLGFAAGDDDLYRYVGNAPVEFSDPAGEGGLPRVWVLLEGGLSYGIDRGDNVHVGFEIHVYKNNKEVTKIKGNGGYCETHKGQKLLSPSEFRRKYGDAAYKRLRNEIKKQAKNAKKAGWGGALGATTAVLMFMIEGYVQGLEAATDKDSAYQTLVRALACGDVAGANKAADAFYDELIDKGAGATTALNWKRAWDNAINEASKDNGDD